MEALLALEREVNAELEERATAEREQGLHKKWPINDGVVDEALYLACSPKMLWLLKEPWETEVEEEEQGGWSATKHAIPRKIKERSFADRGFYTNMAWVTFAVLNGYQTWQQLPWATLDPKVGESLMNIAYINISKMPGKSTSYWPFLTQCYEQNRDMLLRQITTIAPDVIIGGGTLGIFLRDLGLDWSEFAAAGSVHACYKGGRLYVNAYHPAHRSSPELYVDGVVAAIKQFRHHWEPAVTA